MHRIILYLPANGGLSAQPPPKTHLVAAGFKVSRDGVLPFLWDNPTRLFGFAATSYGHSIRARVGYVTALGTWRTLDRVVLGALAPPIWPFNFMRSTSGLHDNPLFGRTKLVTQLDQCGLD